MRQYQTVGIKFEIALDNEFFESFNSLAECYKKYKVLKNIYNDYRLKSYRVVTNRIYDFDNGELLRTHIKNDIIDMRSMIR